MLLRGGSSAVGLCARALARTFSQLSSNAFSAKMGGWRTHAHTQTIITFTLLLLSLRLLRCGKPPRINAHSTAMHKRHEREEQEERERKKADAKIAALCGPVALPVREVDVARSIQILNIAFVHDGGDATYPTHATAAAQACAAFVPRSATEGGHFRIHRTHTT